MSDRVKDKQAYPSDASSSVGTDRLLISMLGLDVHPMIFLGSITNDGLRGYIPYRLEDRALYIGALERRKGNTQESNTEPMYILLKGSNEGRKWNED